jgi:hypothetical protein
MTPNNTQTEQIVWHLFENEKPTILGYYQIQLGYSHPSKTFDYDIWDGFRFTESHKYSNIVFAWAELPKGWLE